MPKITSIYIEKGLSVEVADGKWRRQTIGLTADVSMIESEEDLAKSKVALEQKIDDWLNIGEVTKTKEQKIVEREIWKKVDELPEELVSANGIPKLDIADLDSLPWNPPAASWGQEWIKNPTEFTQFECEGLPTLLELSKALFSTGKTMKDQKLVIGDMEYSFSGKDKETGEPKRLFIQRKPIKRESAK